MKKNYKLFLYFLVGFILFSLINISTRNYASSRSDDAYLVLDSLSVDAMPRNFRTTSNLSLIKNSNLNLFGLDTLNISGSYQFSAENLPKLVEAINSPYKVSIIDLRQESHGFINGLPISFANLKNNANIGLSKNSVLIDESTRLSSIKLNAPITFHNDSSKTIIPTKVQSEESLVTSNNLSYVRIPVTDLSLPTDNMIDSFMDLFDTSSNDHWFHFHCKAGQGRTTTFMIMYDMLKNSENVSKDDIINRQLLLANFNDTILNGFNTSERSAFLSKFYEYSKKRNTEKNLKWSNYKKKYSSLSIKKDTLGYPFLLLLQIIK